MSKIDEATGLPELPKGYFWQVTRRNIIGNFEVHLRKRILGFISKDIDYHQLRVLTKENVFYAARTLKSEHLGTLYRPLDMNDYTLIGKYPPKSLRAVE